MGSGGIELEHLHVNGTIRETRREEYGPVIPGPEMKNPNTSLYSELIQVKYSLDPKT